MAGAFWDDVRRALQSREDRALFRQRKIVEPTGPVTLSLDARPFVNFCSNNYLGLTHHPRLLAIARDAASVGAGAAGLISGHTPAHAAAEAALAAWKHTDAALLMPSGYQANLAVVQTLLGIAEASGRPVRFLVDKLAHASLIDAVRQHDVRFRIFPHNGLSKLARLLADAPPDERQVVLTESIFSMDGDAADLRGIAELKRRHDFVLFVDEAHGSGLFGRHGAGLIDALGVSDAVDISLVTLSKALGLSGAAICGNELFIRAVQNFGRAYIYSTAVPPLAAQLAHEAVRICIDEPHLRERALQHAQHVRQALAAQGWHVPAGESPIVPVIVGEAPRALQLADRLRDEGLLVAAVRPPTVPPATSRLRITLSAAHSDAHVARLLDAMQRAI
ncbi:MAG: aminotransferase class I/II-fold pyridoxal phosphate-dependent enzyme [Tepidisphaeraceae bacterium]